MTYTVVEEVDSSSLDSFEEVRCEFEFEPGSRLFLLAVHDIETNTSNLTVKLLDIHVVEDVTLQGTRVEDEQGFVNYITTSYVFRFKLDASTGIPTAKYAILEGTDQSYDLGNSCHIN